MSLEHLMRIRALPVLQTNFLYSYEAVPTVRKSFITKDLYACSILLCDHFPRKAMDSFTPTPSYRFNATYKEISNVRTALCAYL